MDQSLSLPWQCVRGHRRQVHGLKIINPLSSWLWCFFSKRLWRSPAQKILIYLDRCFCFHLKCYFSLALWLHSVWQDWTIFERFWQQIFLNCLVIFLACLWKMVLCYKTAVATFGRNLGNFKCQFWSHWTVISHFCREK